jgi:hypothetical protein
MTYEIRDGQGRCLYRGNDLALACEIHDQDRDARLVRVAPTDLRRNTDVPGQLSHGNCPTEGYELARSAR